MKNVFAVIIGQGIAGTTVGWELLRRGLDFIGFDGGEPSASSRIAAGLVTPVTGKRGVLTWSWYHAWKTADAHYRNCEQATASQFWYPTQALRLYESRDEAAYLSERFTKQANLPIENYARDALERDSKSYDNDCGGFSMPTAAQLDTQTYLAVSQSIFRTEVYSHEKLDLSADFVPSENGWRLPRFDIRCRCLVFAQGYAPAPNPWFPEMPLVPSRGDILRIEAHLLEERTIHRQVWFTRDRTSQPRTSTTSETWYPYLIGSTYRWHQLDGPPRLEDREEIEAKFRSWFKSPYRVVDHRSGVRPSSYGQRPLLKSRLVPSPCHTINGLGAKGVLYAPWMAQVLVDSIVDGIPIPDEFSWRQR